MRLPTWMSVTLCTAMLVCAIAATALAQDAPQSPRRAHPLAGTSLASSTWENFKNIRQGKAVPEDRADPAAPAGEPKRPPPTKAVTAPTTTAPQTPATAAAQAVSATQPAPPVTPPAPPATPPSPAPTVKTPRSSDRASPLFEGKAVSGTDIVDLAAVPTKIDTQPVQVVIPNSVAGIYWLDMKIPVASTYRFQGYFAPRFPWVAKGVSVPAHSYQSNIWIDSKDPASGQVRSEQRPFTLSHKGYYPVTYQVNKDLKGGENLLLRAHLYGWGGSSNYCEDFGEGDGYISVRNCASEYPDNSMDRGLCVWTYFGGHVPGGTASNENGERVAESLLSVAARHSTSIDHGAGITLSGTSYGGTGGILLSMSIPRVQEKISVVQANVPYTLFLETYFRRNPQMMTSWQGVNVDEVDFRKVAPTGLLDHIYYRIHGGHQDDDANNTGFYRICNLHKIACLGTWHGGGHEFGEAGVNIPTDLYPGDPNMQARLDAVLPVFTNSTGNSPLNAPRGHYNLGLSWNSKGIVDEAGKLIVPLKYKAFKRFSSTADKPMADMPDAITASVTIRRAQQFAIAPGATFNWRFGPQQAGVVQAHAQKPELTIDGLRFASSDQRYTWLVLTPRPAQ
jgi:hypothetical protein